MTDQGPLQPDYRRRMEAAEAEIERLKRVLAMTAETARDERTRAEAAEQRVKELEAGGKHADHRGEFDATCARCLCDHYKARADAAEAREQALRDERDALLERVAFQRAELEKQAAKIGSLLSPPTAAHVYDGECWCRSPHPTADTEESDRG